MIVSILPHSLKPVQPTQQPAVVLKFQKEEKIIRVLGYPKEEFEVQEFCALFEEMSGLNWDKVTTDWMDYNESLMNQEGMPVAEAVS